MPSVNCLVLRRREAGEDLKRCNTRLFWYTSFYDCFLSNSNGKKHVEPDSWRLQHIHQGNTNHDRASFEQENKILKGLSDYSDNLKASSWSECYLESDFHKDAFSSHWSILPTDRQKYNRILKIYVKNAVDKVRGVFLHSIARYFVCVLHGIYHTVSYVPINCMCSAIACASNRQILKIHFLVIAFIHMIARRFRFVSLLAMIINQFYPVFSSHLPTRWLTVTDWKVAMLLLNIRDAIYIYIYIYIYIKNKYTNAIKNILFKIFFD